MLNLFKEKKPTCVVIGIDRRNAVHILQPKNGKVSFPKVDGQQFTVELPATADLHSAEDKLPVYVVVEGIPVPVNPAWLIEGNRLTFAARLNELLEREALLADVKAHMKIMKKFKLDKRLVILLLAVAAIIVAAIVVGPTVFKPAAQTVTPAVTPVGVIG